MFRMGNAVEKHVARLPGWANAVMGSSKRALPEDRLASD